jgi:RTX calcium-binding nonapeptide repeat (4 copies)
MRDIIRSRLLARAALALGLLAASATPALAEPGLPRTYDVTPVESSNPLPGGGGNFGWGLTSADLTGDGKMELIVAQSQDNVPGEIFIYDGVTSQVIDTIGPPETNPGGTGQALAFVYVEHMADIGGCPGGDGPDADQICDATTVGAPDGIPEIIAGSRALRVDPVSPLDSARDASDRTVGRGYVFDGKTRAVLKRLDMPPAHRQEMANRNATGAQFGRVMMSPHGLPPCAGPASEGNNAGVGPCPSTTDVPQAVRIGDIDGTANSADPAVAGTARADIVVGVRGYRETRDPGHVNTAPPGSQCATTAPVFNNTSGDCTAGKGFVFRGEEIAGSSPREILDGVTNGNATGVNTPETEPKTLTNPFGQTDSGDVFGNLQRIGDVGSCTPPTPAQLAAGASPIRCFSRNFAPDAKPEIVATDAFLDYPVANPDPQAFPDIGAAYVYDGQTGLLRDVYEHPEAANRAVFSHNFNSGWPTGNLGHSTLPDFMSGAPVQSVREVSDGRAYVWNGEATSSRGRLIGVIDDPTPKPAGNFGSSYTGVGDLKQGSEFPTNEVMIGSYSPFFTSTEAAQALISDVSIFNATRNRVLQTIPDPVQEPGSGFGVGITPMGDLNNDGFLDFAISSYLSNLPGQPAEGRAYIFKSNNRPLPAPPNYPGPTISRARILRAGNCTNDTVGTARGDVLRGTTAGDRIFGFGGNDRIAGYQSADCLDGGAGVDRIAGGIDPDRLIGRSGNDRLYGGNDRDRLFGTGGRDRLRGGNGRDILAGGSGGDWLDGGPETDKIYGEGGDDRLRSGGDRNRLDGGTGDDVIFARNHRQDRIACGSGRDRVVADRTDIVSVDCENIRRPG